MKRFPLWSWLSVLIGSVYFLAPLVGTFIFALEKERDALGFAAFASALADPLFLTTFSFSLEMAVITIVASVILMVPTAYWVNLYVPRARAAIEFITLLPFVIPAIVLVFGLIRTYSHSFDLGFVRIPALTELSTETLLVGGYMILALPYMYRAIDNGLRAMDARALTEAGQSLGANGFTILWRIILPNLRTSVLSGALLTIAIVVGEFTLSGFFVGDQRAFGPYLVIVGNHRAFDAAALTLLSFALTWVVMLIIQWITRGAQTSLTGAH